MYGTSGNQLYWINFGVMKNKKYLDKVLEYLIKGTKVKPSHESIYEGILVYMPFDGSPPEFMSVNDYHETSFPFFSPIPSYMFHNYCVNQFGLVTEEIDYLWEKYSNIMSLKFKDELKKIK
jgi:hypothetical protein